MKKLKLMAFAAVAAFALAACTPSAESLVQQYEKACKAGDTEKIEKLAGKLEAIEDQLTEEQQMRIISASFEAVGSIIENSGLNEQEINEVIDEALSEIDE